MRQLNLSVKAACPVIFNVAQIHTNRAVMMHAKDISSLKRATRCQNVNKGTKMAQPVC